MQLEPRPSLKEIKDTDLVSYLATLGIEPVRVQASNYWYLSPLRQEKTPSFKINRQLNRWIDFGTGQGGSLIDFGIQYFQCSVSSFLKQWQGDILPPRQRHDPTAPKMPCESKITVLEEKPLSAPALLSYLAQRAIPSDLAREFLKEVRYSLAEKTYYALGFANDSGGYELRNQYTKISSSPKDITFQSQASNEVLVFEGFFDMLSYQQVRRDLQLPEGNLVVLNSIAFFHKTRPLLERHEKIHLFLDRDLAGRHLTKTALALTNAYQDASGFYQTHKDINEWLQSAHRPHQQHKRIVAIPIPGRL